MADFYLDPEGGNDANAGTSFALRKRSINSLTAAQLAPGDTVRVIASRDPYTLGNGTWTDSSNTVTLAAAKTLTIDNCDSAWTPSTNVTATAQTSFRKQGTACAQLDVASAFTTGKVAFRATGTLNLSAYQALSLWFRSSAAVAANTLRVDLCSDTLGATPVHSFTIDRALTASTWAVLYKDFGAALSSSIQSISVVALLDPGAVSVYLDNIIACKPVGDADHLSHLTLIGKNSAGEPEWYPIGGIDGTTVTLGGPCESYLSSNTIPNYRGTTETVATYALDPVDMVNPSSGAAASAASRLVTDSGTEASPITLSGGWNRTDMSTQTGASWLTGSHWAAAAFSFAGFNSWTLRKLGFAHFTTSAWSQNTATYNMDAQAEGIVGCGTASSGVYAFDLLSAYSSNAGLVCDLGNVMNNHNAVRTSGAARVKLTARRISGSVGELFVCSVRQDSHDYYIGKLDRSQSTSGAAWLNTGVGRGVTTFYNTVFVNNTFADLTAGSAWDGGVVLSHCTLNHASSPIGNGGNNPEDSVVLHKTVLANAGVAGLGSASGSAGTYSGAVGRYWGWCAATDQRHTASGFSWKYTTTTTAGTLSWTVFRPFKKPIGRYQATAGVPLAIKAWVRRSSTSLNVGILVPCLTSGIDSEATTWASGAINTWEELTVSVTPTEDGIIDVFAVAYGGNTGTSTSGWWDDLSVTA